METYLDTKTDLDVLKDKLLYYPFSGSDFNVPICMFLDYLNEFWFVDKCYFSQTSSLQTDLGVLETRSELKFLSETFTGQESAEMKDATDSRPYRYLEPGYLEKLYLYKGHKKRIILRRGLDYTSLFGPSSLEIACERLGIFFFRGTSGEGGSNHPWISDVSVRMLYGEKKVKLLPRVLDALPNGGLIVTDASLGYFYDRPMKKTNQ